MVGSVAPVGPRVITPDVAILPTPTPSSDAPVAGDASTSRFGLVSSTVDEMYPIGAVAFTR